MGIAKDILSLIEQAEGEKDKEDDEKEKDKDKEDDEKEKDKKLVQYDKGEEEEG